MQSITFSFCGQKYTHEFFFGTKPINWFGIKDTNGKWHDCCYNMELDCIFIFGQDSDYLEETSVCIA